jgi:hypothetical protein
MPIVLDGTANTVTPLNGALGATTPNTINTTGITFADATTQTTAAVSAAGGVTNTTSAVSITLTSSSNATQNVAMTAVDKAVILPAATTITKLGSDLFTINNTGAYHFYIQLSAGGYINHVAPGGSVTLSLADNTTSDGKWVQSDLGYTAYKMYDYSAFLLPSAIIATQKSAVSVVGFRLSTVQQMSATTYVIGYTMTANDCYMVVATVSGTSVSYGTPVSMGFSGGFSGILKYSDTTGIAIGIQTPSNVIARPFSISGSTITLGTVGSVASTVMAYIPNNGETLSSTLGAIITVALSTGAVSVRSLTYNGASAPTFGTISALVSPNPTAWAQGASLAITSSTTACVVYANTATPWAVVGRVATFSGTSAPTLGTAVSLGTDVERTVGENTDCRTNITFRSGTEYLVTCRGLFNWQKTITVSGTTVSAPTASVPLPLINSSSVGYISSSSSTSGAFERNEIPMWMTTSTGLVVQSISSPPSVGNGGNTMAIKEAKFISGYGWLTGLTMPRHIAFYTPTGLNQASGLFNGQYGFPKISILDSSTMLVTTMAGVSAYYGNANFGNDGYTIYSFIIKPTT